MVKQIRFSLSRIWMVTINLLPISTVRFLSFERAMRKILQLWQRKPFMKPHTMVLMWFLLSQLQEYRYNTTYHVTKLLNFFSTSDFVLLLLIATVVPMFFAKIAMKYFNVSYLSAYIF